MVKVTPYLFSKGPGKSYQPTGPTLPPQKRHLITVKWERGERRVISSHFFEVHTLLEDVSGSAQHLSEQIAGHHWRSVTGKAWGRWSAKSVPIKPPYKPPIQERLGLLKIRVFWKLGFWRLGMNQSNLMQFDGGFCSKLVNHHLGKS